MAFATAGRSRRYGVQRLPDPPPCRGEFHLWRYVDRKAGKDMRCSRVGCGRLFVPVDLELKQ